jgi:hypothetical protein
MEAMNAQVYAGANIFNGKVAVVSGAARGIGRARSHSIGAKAAQISPVSISAVLIEGTLPSDNLFTRSSTT